MSRLTKLYNEKNFQNLAIIGHGSYGQVYMALSPVTGNNVVLKQLSKQRSRVDDVLKEVTVLRHLRDVCEPYSLCYVDFLEDNNYFYIITEYLDQQKYMTIEDFIDQQVDLIEEKKFRLIDNLKRGLAIIHQKNVAHRDIKPANIMINPKTADIKYIDFGLSCYNEQCIGVIETARGSAPYMPPELLLFEKLGTPPHDLQTWLLVDLWELGTTIIEIFLGIPFVDTYNTAENGTDTQNLQDVIWVSEDILKKGQRLLEIILLGMCDDNMEPNDRLRSYIFETVNALMKINPFERRII